MTDGISAIDKAIAAAQARKAAKAAGGMVSTNDIGNFELPMAKSKVTKERAPKVTAEQRAAKNAEREVARNQRKAERDAQRTARKAEKEATRGGKTPHMSKVEKAAAGLPALDSSIELTFNEITANFTAAQISALAAHLQHFNRVKATERALNRTLQAGDTVRIVSGAAKFIGMVGTVSKAQRIRCYVEVPGVRKPIYLFTSDVELSESNEELQVAV